MLAGDHLFNPAAREMFEADVYEPDPHLRQAFALAGRRSLSEEDLDVSASHAHTLHVIGPGGSLEAVRSISGQG
jgi:hypothetical protein